MASKHHITTIISDMGESYPAQSPIIISVSRATDIPAFYTDWFFRRLEKGYVRWLNPFSGKNSYISFADTQFIVFWSKNPAPLLPHLSTLKENGIGCYIQYTLNDYEDERLEPYVPGLNYRIDTFKRLVDTLGLGSVVWRFDPLIISDRISIDNLLDKIKHIGDELKGYAEKLVFSFVDIATYKKVGRNLTDAGVNYREWDESAMLEFAFKLATLNRENWNYQLATCSEAIPLEEFDIRHNRCIDPDLIARLSPNNTILQNFLHGATSDKGQRLHCGCILSKDIGAYNTCAHGCAYCYANTSRASALTNYHKHNPDNDSII